MKTFIFKTILLVCLTTGLPGLFIACKKDSNDNDQKIGGGTTFQYYKIKSFAAKNGDKNDASGEAKTSVKKEDYFIKITNETESADAPQASTAFVIPFINTAHAENLVWSNADTIKSVKIITIKNFNQNLPAGSDVTDKFGLGPNLSLLDWQAMRILSSYFRPFKPSNQLPFLPIFLNISPEAAIQAAQFKLVYTLNSGKQLEATTPEVDLL